MTERRTALIIAKEGYGVADDTANMVIDSRKPTFVYLDRSGYKQGVYRVTVTGASVVPLHSIVIPHGLNYPPSARIYVAGYFETPDSIGVSGSVIIKEPTFQAADPYIVCSTDSQNVYLDILRGNVFSNPTFDILILIGADNLDKKPDEDIYL